MFNIKETANNIKTTAAKVNKEVLKTSEVVVEETLAAGEEWNKVFAKALKTGTHIFGLQQELAIMTLEGVKKQYETGNKRFRKLLGFQTGAVEKAVKETTAKVEKKAKKVLSSSTAKAKTTKAKTKKVLASTAKEVKVAAPKAAKKVLSSTKKTAAPAKKVLATTKKVVATKTTAKSDLKVINGVGPKMEKVLNAAGIATFADLAAFKAADLKNILLAENARYAMYEPKEWIAEAKTLATK